MVDRRPYVVVIGGVGHTVLLDEAEAKRLGLSSPVEPKAKRPKNKARTTRNKQ